MTGRLIPCQVQPWPKGYTRFRAVNACMRNANELAQKYRDLTIIKGYARNEFGHWLGHWWCVDDEMRVLDPTWKNRGTAYIGVERVDLKDHCLRILATGAYELELESHAPQGIVEALERAARLQSVCSRPANPHG